jgi:hypothetical protein
MSIIGQTLINCRSNDNGPYNVEHALMNAICSFRLCILFDAERA